MTEDSTVWLDNHWLDDHQQRVWRLWLEVSTTLPAVLNRQLSRDSQLSVQDFEVLTSRVWRSEASSNVASAVLTAGEPSFTSPIQAWPHCDRPLRAMLPWSGASFLAGLIAAISTSLKPSYREFARALLRKTTLTPRTSVEARTHRRSISRPSHLEKRPHPQDNTGLNISLTDADEEHIWQ